jgi:hypothetical protein
MKSDKEKMDEFFMFLRDAVDFYSEHLLKDAEPNVIIDNWWPTEEDATQKLTIH